MEKYNRCELLSPAGDLITLKAAIENGADAVYIGGKNFSARKNAKNFSDEEIFEAVSYAHLRGAKVYVTLNTLIYDSELKDAYEFIKMCCKADVDALIVQDLAIVNMCKEYFPQIEIHSSTQMTVASLRGVEMMKSLGFSRAVLAREMTKQEIEYICKNTDTEIEVFVHGALCVCYSGQCLLSSIIGARSGNRGACAQPCRLAYSLYNYGGKCIAKDKYVLSLKDLCLVDYLDELSKISVASLKIEGRMKNKEYVSIVTDVYNKQLNNEKLTGDDYFRLKNIFSRTGFTDAYYMGKPGFDMICSEKNNDDIYKKVSDDVLNYGKMLSEKSVRKRRISFDIRIDDRIYCSAICDSYEAEVVSDDNIVSDAINAPTSEERIREQFKKLGDTAFYCNDEDIKCSIRKNAFVSVKDLNNIRRECVLQLEKLILSNNRAGNFKPFKYEKVKKTKKSILLNAEVTLKSQAYEALKMDFDKVFVPYDIYICDREFFEKSKKAVCVLPQVDNLKNYDLDLVSSVSVSNIGQIPHLKGKTIYGQPSLNVFNGIASDEYAKLGLKTVALSYEMNLNKIRNINTNTDCEVVIYGRIPLMNTKNCLHKAFEKRCGCSSDKFMKLKDRKGKVFFVKTNPQNCTNTIYNSEPIYMADKMDDIKNSGVSAVRMLFTTENAKEMHSIFESYQKKIPPTSPFTRGHFYRGV